MQRQVAAALSALHHLFFPPPSPRTGVSVRCLRAALWVWVAALAGACATAGTPEGGPFPRFAEYAGREVERVEFVGDLLIPEDSLREVTITRASRCRILFIPICIGGLGRDRYFLELEALGRDVVRQQLVYRDQGYYGSRILPAVDPVGENRVRVRFAVEPGDLVTLRSLEVEGTEEIVPPDELERRLRLRVDEPFRRIDFLASADTIQAEMLRRGFAYSQVLRNYQLDTIADIADVQYQAVPGPLVRVDTIVFLGGERLGERTARRQLTFRRGDVLRNAELERSQRNLYDLGIVSFATVELAPEELQRDTTPANATVLVRLLEAPQFLVDATAGYGTLDCLRAGVRRVNRNFLGGARRLELSAAASKIGVGAPLAFGLEGGVCSQLQGDRFSDTVNYRVAADFEQPDLFGTRTSGLLNVRTERVSELRTYVRVATGAQAALIREVLPQTLVTTTLSAERGRTDAPAIFFCFALDQCTEEDIAPLRRFRWSNSLNVSTVRNRARVVGGLPTGGYQARSSAEWATELLGSDDRYLRLLAEGSVYREVRPGWTLGARLLGGTFPQGRVGDPDSYIPPERRFYLGGPNSVRGYGQNQLGPVAYVAEIDTVKLAAGEPLEEALQNTRASALGGTSSVLGSVELQIPSPFLPQFLRVAAFADAGLIRARGSDYADVPLRVTPGAGIRLVTPVGPIRLDAAYNPWGLAEGPLYVIDPRDPQGRLTLVRRDFRRPLDGFFDRVRLHIAVGQAF
ncbi:MAG: BamA/TamA family outer membrane protein [Gemmatimonadota bacterium]|nr:BamA/TamA family outer membrane protein [Gemmatimonadota bacterium]